MSRRAGERAARMRDEAAAAAEPLPRFARDWALFLDVDGTLLDLAEHPRGVQVEPALVEALGRLQGLAGGAVALISGRSIGDLDRLFAPLVLAAAGQHGAERRHENGAIDIDRSRTSRFARETLAALAGQHPGLLFEDKGATLAMHYRHAPELQGLVESTLGAIARRSAGEWTLQTGKMVRELVPHGRNKGGAIAAFLHEPPFADRVPVFIGDDDTDEHGFALVRRLRGYAVKVGPEPSIAQHRIPDASGVRVWLAAYADWLESTT
jgi:trehalose 6-phosphate phosphatase